MIIGIQRSSHTHCQAPQAQVQTKGLQKSFRLSNPRNRLSGRF